MKTKSFKISKSTLYIFLGVLLFCSCASPAKLKYFKDMPQLKDGTEFEMTKFQEAKIQPDDILNIRVNTVDLEASEAINNGNNIMPGNNLNVIGNSGINQMVTGYLVAEDGTVDIPVLGTIEVGGSTLLEAKTKIKERAETYYKNSNVSIRFSNFRVSVLGEVSRPGTFVIPNQRISILDAIAFSGDLNVYGKRDNVMLIRRDDAGKAVAVKMNLNSKEIYNSPFFYLKQNDMIYVEPARAKLLNSDTSIVRYLSLLASLVSVGILVIRN